MPLNLAHWATQVTEATSPTRAQEGRARSWEAAWLQIRKHSEPWTGPGPRVASEMVLRQEKLFTRSEKKYPMWRSSGNGGGAQKTDIIYLPHPSAFQTLPGCTWRWFPHAPPRKHGGKGGRLISARADRSHRHCDPSAVLIISRWARSSLSPTFGGLNASSPAPEFGSSQI